MSQGKTIRVTKAIALAGLAILANSFGEAANARCKGNPAVVGICHTLHGRFSVYNGSLIDRIWPVGTTRLLAVVNPDDPSQAPVIPDAINALLALGTLTGVAVFGDYEVCPITRSEPDHMQLVCLEKAMHLVAQSLWEGHPLHPQHQ